MTMQAMTIDNNRDSIRYDTAFLECLLCFTDAQLAPESNPGNQAATPTQRRDQRDALCDLCNVIDLFAERMADAKNKSGREEAE